MKAKPVVAVLVLAYAVWLPPGLTAADESKRHATPRESRIPAGNAELYSREVGQGTAIIVLHGGPDFDHSYLVPEMDRLSDSFHLIYYDQRGRGRSADRVQPEARPEDFEKIIARLRLSFTKEGILKARAIESRLMNETWSSPGYDLLPKLKSLRIPTLVIYGDHEFIPAATAMHITQAMPHARMVTLKDCGHFSYLECHAAVREHIDAFFVAR